LKIHCGYNIDFGFDKFVDILMLPNILYVDAFINIDPFICPLMVYSKGYFYLFVEVVSLCISASNLI